MAAVRSTENGIQQSPKAIMGEWLDAMGQDTVQEQLHQSRKMEALGQLAGGMAHDFNNLLSVIAGYVEMLLSRLEETSPAHFEVMEIRTAVDRAGMLTRQLLAFSRRQVLEPVVLNPNTMVRGHLEMLRRMIHPSIQLTTRLDPQLGCVKADAGQLEQVIMNLVLNARDAMPHGGRITIETAHVEAGEQGGRDATLLQEGKKYVMVAVSDTGTGMDPATRARIFEPFFTTKEKGKGTGLGLSTVHGIVRQAGGDIAVWSEVGRGTTLRIYLPRLESVQASAEDETKRLPAPVGSETLLVVEDEEKLRPLICRTLRRFGYTVLEAGSGDEALRMSQAHEGRIDLLLTDVILPRMSGFDVAKEMVSSRPDLKVLYMSGYVGNAEAAERAMKSGATIMQKPFAPESLARKIRAILNAKSSIPTPLPQPVGRHSDVSVRTER